MALTNIKAVLFDAYGTLFDIHSPAAQVEAELGPNAKAISDLWRAKQLQYTWLRSLMQAFTQFDTITADALDFALANYGVDNPAVREKMLKLYLSLDAYPDAVSALQTLNARGIKTGILSNGSSNMLGAAVGSANLGDLLDHVLSVENVGVYKPDPRVYRYGQETVDVPASEIGFVSANGWDAAGAAYFGFQVVHLNRFDQPRENLPAGPALVVKSLGDAAKAMEK